MLTGGRGAERLYKTWVDIPAYREMTGATFYFGDERCVSPECPESNYGMAMRTLFCQGTPKGCAIVRMEADDPDLDAAALRYENRLPDKVDVLLLGLGDDGHIASLFPGDEALQEVTRRVMHVVGPKPPYDRLTITPPVIINAKSVFLLATGKKKAPILTLALNRKEDTLSLPVRLLCGRTWLLDTDAADQVSQDPSASQGSDSTSAIQPTTTPVTLSCCAISQKPKTIK
jgi:6-phosphogluconolactonase